MNRFKIIFLLTALACPWFGHPAFASGLPFGTGNDLLAACKPVLGPADTWEFEQGTCAGLVAGIYLGKEISSIRLSGNADSCIKSCSSSPEEFHCKARCNALFKAASWDFCVPKDVPVSQLVRVVVKYLEEHPAQLHNPAHGLVYASLKDAFPCTDSSNR